MVRLTDRSDMTLDVYHGRKTTTQEQHSDFGPGHAAQSVGHLTRKSEVLGFDTQSGHILWFLLPLIQEGQLPVTGESMCTKYCLTP